MSTSSEKVQKLDASHHFKMYKRFPITLVAGKGALVTDIEGKTYIDALAGIAVNSVGHCHPGVVEAIQDQAEKLIHISNIYYNVPQSTLAALLCQLSKMDRVMFCNSGAEANEAAIKLARKYAHQKGKQGEILSMENCFHGRTLGTIAMGKAKYQNGFQPMSPGFRSLPFNDLNSLNEITDDTTAVFIEPIQGEGGIHMADKKFLKALRKKCNETDTLLIFDEIQCGVGRTGKMFAWQYYGVKPDILSTAKALGGGFPIGALLAREKIAAAFEPGDHGTTYGGNPLACAAAYATLKAIVEEDLCTQAEEKGSFLMAELQKLQKKNSHIKEIRGVGLMVGIELDFKGADVVKKMMEQGVLANVTMDYTIRLVPPLVISEEQLKKVVDVLDLAIQEVQEKETQNA